MNRRKFLLGIGASLGAAYGLKRGRFGALARKAAKPRPVVVLGDTHFGMIPKDRPLQMFLHQAEWDYFKSQGVDMAATSGPDTPLYVLLGDIVS